MAGLPGKLLRAPAVPGVVLPPSSVSGAGSPGVPPTPVSPGEATATRRFSRALATSPVRGAGSLESDAEDSVILN